MIIDGKQIAQDILIDVRAEINELGITPTLHIVSVGFDPVRQNFLRIKKLKAEIAGIAVKEHIYKESVTTQELVDTIQNIDDGCIIVQLPLPEHIERDTVLNAIPQEKDVDVLSQKSQLLFIENNLSILPPTTGAIVEILKTSDISLDGKDVVVVGRGVLVGKPAIIWLKHQNADLTVVDEFTENITRVLKEADIIISGAGKPGLIRPDMIKEGVILLDAGTSESGGKVVGDADPLCSEKSKIFTPVPGGIGPITVALLMKNVLTYTR